MIDVGLFMLVIWILKNVAEDTITTVKGQTNPRIERRRARQKSRANNPIWTQLVGWAGDIAEDARQDAADSRRRKREKRQREQELAEQRDRELAEQREQELAEQRDRERAEAEWARPAQALDPEMFGRSTEPVDIPLDNEKEEQKQQPQPEQGGPEATSPDAGPLPDNVIPFARPKKFDPKEYPVSTQVNGEVTGLDPAISYANSLAMFAGEHGQAGNEGYIGFLQQSDVRGDALQSAHDMQEAFAAAQAAAAKHAQELDKQKAVQEAYNANPDAGDKQFQTNGQ